MTWTPRHDVFLAELRRRLAAELPVADTNVCFEAAAIAAQVAAEHGIPAEPCLGWWHAPGDTPIEHAWTLLDAAFIVHARRKNRGLGIYSIEVCRPSADFRPWRGQHEAQRTRVVVR